MYNYYQNFVTKKYITKMTPKKASGKYTTSILYTS